jgi:predicted PurR-regulated permease PerM
MGAPMSEEPVAHARERLPASEGRVVRPLAVRAGLTAFGLLAVLFFSFFLLQIQSTITLMVVSILLAAAIAGPVDYLHRRWRLRRGLAILLVYLAILLALAVAVTAIVPPIAREGTAFAREFPSEIERLRAELAASNNPLLRAAGTELFELLDGERLTGALASLPSVILGAVSGVGGGIVAVFTVFLITFYWLSEKPLVKRAVVGLFPTQQRLRALRLWGQVEAKLGDWIRGQLLLMIVIGVIATIAYGAMGLSFWLVLGLIAGLTEALPNIGPVIGAVPAVLVALTDSWQKALAVVGFVTVLQLLENAVLVPRIMKGAVGLSPLVVILAIIAGGEFRGVVGALLAVPNAAAVSVIIGDLARERRNGERAISPASARSPRASAAPPPAAQAPMLRARTPLPPVDGEGEAG